MVPYQMCWQLAIQIKHTNSSNLVVQIVMQLIRVRMQLVEQCGSAMIVWAQHQKLSRI